MLVSILANLVMEGGVIPPITRHNVPDAPIEEKGGYGEDVQDKRMKMLRKNDEEFLIMMSKWITEQN